MVLTNMGISHPIKHGHINDGESLPHTAPMEVNLVNVPINEGFENGNSHNCGEFKSHMVLTNMGISYPIKHGTSMMENHYPT